MWRNLILAAIAALFALPAFAGQPLGLGRTPTAQEIAGWNIDILPDGTGLPPGQGSMAQGEQIFATTCAACHGAHGEAGDNNPVPRLAGGRGSLSTPHPLRTVGSYWPMRPRCSTTSARDAAQRAANAHADQVYAVAAYVLYLNGIVLQDTALSRANLSAIEMPNRAGFVRAGAGQGKRVRPTLSHCTRPSAGGVPWRAALCAERGTLQPALLPRTELTTCTPRRKLSCASPPGHSPWPYDGAAAEPYSPGAASRESAYLIYRFERA